MLPFEDLAQKGAGRPGIAPGSEAEMDWMPVLIDGLPQIPPFSTSSYLRVAYVPVQADPLAALAPPPVILDGGLALLSAKDRCAYPSLRKHFSVSIGLKDSFIRRPIAHSSRLFAVVNCATD